MKIPRDVSGATLVKALRRLGYEVVRQDGSHIRLTTRQNGEHHLTVPNHNPMRLGTLSGILKDTALHHDLTLDRLLEKLDL